MLLLALGLLSPQAASADLTGAWRFSGIETSTNSDAIGGWLRGRLAFDAAFSVVSGALSRPIGTEATPTGSLGVDADGRLSGRIHLSPAFDLTGVRSVGDDLVVLSGTAVDGDRFTLLTLVRDSDRLPTLTEVAGTWRIEALATPDTARTRGGFIGGTITVASDGRITSGTVSVPEAYWPSAGGTVTVAADGTLSVSITPADGSGTPLTLDGTMTPGADAIAGVLTRSITGPRDLGTFVMTRVSPTTTLLDLAGTWHVRHFVVQDDVGDAGSWLAGTLTIDDDGQVDGDLDLPFAGPSTVRGTATVDTAGNVELFFDGLEPTLTEVALRINLRGALRPAGDIGVTSANVWVRPDSDAGLRLHGIGTLIRRATTPGTPVLMVSPPGQWFGEVVIGETATRAFQVKNAGDGMLTGSASTVPPFSVVSGQTFSLEPGQVQDVLIAFSPAEDGEASATVQIESNGGSRARDVMGVGRTATPELAVDRTAASLEGPAVVTLKYGPGSSGEWVGLFPTAGGSYVDWQWTSGGQSTAAAVPANALTFPSGGRRIAAGTYVFRWIADGQTIAESAAVQFVDMPAAPGLTSLDPTGIVVGTGAQTLRVTGSAYGPTSVIQIAGAPRVTTFVSTTGLSTMLSAADVATAGSTLSIAVATPPVGGLGGGVSAALTLAIVAPPAAPTITSLSPASAGIGAPPLPVTVRGTGFVPMSRVRVDGADRATTFISATELRVTLMAADLALGGARHMDVLTPPPGGGVAEPAAFTVVGPTLAIDRTTASPSGPITATFSNGPGHLSDWFGVFPLAGGDFVDWQWASGGRVGAQPRTSGAVTFPTGGGTLKPGTYVVRWMSGGQIAQSAAFTLMEIPPAPVLERLDPGQVVAGGGAQTLRVIGSGFRASSVVRVGGVARTTAYVSATELTTTLTAADTAVVGTRHEVSVSTPALSGVGGGESGVLAVMVTTGPTLALDRSAAPLAGPVTATFDSGPGRSGEWIGVFPATGGGYVDWQWVSGGQANSQARTTGTLTFPTGGRALAPGAYVLQWMSGGQVLRSASVTLADIVPAPALAHLDPGSIVAGTGAQTLRAIGSGFTASSTLHVAGASRATTFVSATELTTSLSAADTATAGTTHAVTVITPPLAGLGGGESASATLAIVAPPPAPTVESIAPASVASGASATVTVRGAAFVGASRVRVDGIERATTFVSATELRVALPAADLARAGTRALTVVTSAPGGGTSNAATLDVVGPSIALDRSASALTGPVGATFANGPGRGSEWIGVFPATGGGYVDWQWVSGGQTNSQARTTGTLTFPTGGRALAPGTYVLRWVAGGQIAESAAFTLADMPGTPVLDTLVPGSLVVGAGARTLRVIGGGFHPSSVVRLGGVARATTFVSATELAAVLTAADASVVGTQHAVTVSTPPANGVGGGESTARTLPVVTGPAIALDRTTASTTESITATFAHGSGGGSEWMGVFPVGGSGYVDWQWVSGGQSAPQARTGGTLTFPTTGRTLAPGVYVLRWMMAGQITESAAFTVADGPPPAMTVSAAAGAMTVSFANGRGVSGEWIGVFPATTSGVGGYVDWQWMTGGQNGGGVARAGMLTFSTAALPPGSTYAIRWISDGRVVAEALVTR